MSGPHIGNRIGESVIFAADNGRFASPEKYTDNGFLLWLNRQPLDRCLFAVAPDVLADHQATVDLSLPMLPRIRGAGVPVAFVAQDGAQPGDIPWNDFDALFVGGSSQWKFSADSIACMSEAKRRGKYLHIGRVNSYARCRAARGLGADSVDGTFLVFGPDINTPKMLGWFDRLEREPELW